MSFHSAEFVAFLALTYSVWLIVPASLGWLVLLAASLYFCGTYQPVFALQVLAAAAFAFLLAQRLGISTEPTRRKLLLAFAVALLVGNLTLFKYSGSFGFDLLLPIGISFYTFQLIGYLVDVYRGEVPERDPRTFSLFVLFFPKLASGPIERARTFIPQLQTLQRFDYAQTVAGLRLILWGAFKKLVVADHLAPFVAHIYDNPESATGAVTVMATVLYAFQIYCDFSGYTDMALGIAALFGYRLTPNFNRPYIATSIQDFWKRWHISLTSWLTDYVYNPIARQKLLKVKFYYVMLGGLFVTFVISGIWHGSHWNFVLWGALHGAYIVASLQTQKLRARISERSGLARRPRLRVAFRIGFTFTLVCFAYVLFRAENVGTAMDLYASLFRGWSQALQDLKVLVLINPGSMLIGLSGVGVLLLVEMLQARPAVRAAFEGRAAFRRITYFACALAVLMIGAVQGGQDFIYFQF